MAAVVPLKYNMSIWGHESRLCEGQLQVSRLAKAPFPSSTRHHIQGKQEAEEPQTRTDL